MPRNSFFENLVGKKFGCQTVVEYAGRYLGKELAPAGVTKGTVHMWRTVCSCGMPGQASASRLRLRPAAYCRACFKGKLLVQPPEERPKTYAQKRRHEQVQELRATRWEQGQCARCPRPRLPKQTLCELHHAITLMRQQLMRLHLDLAEREERETRPLKESEQNTRPPPRRRCR